MNFVVCLLVGGLMGGVASLLMQAQPRQGLATNILVGVVGALLGGWLVSPLVGGAALDQAEFSAVGLPVALGGAAALLAIVNLASRRSLVTQRVDGREVGGATRRQDSKQHPDQR